MTSESTVPGVAAAEVAAAWGRARAVFLPGAVSVSAWGGPIGETLAAFERLRDGANFLDEIDARVGDSEVFRYAGSTVDHVDQREIERVFVDAVEGRAVLFSDITARLSWIADDPSDLSLRVRFSYGHESLDEWLQDLGGMPWAGRLCNEVYPEAAAIEGATVLQDVLAVCAGSPVQFGERIVYNNAPGGGAVFHHDADPGQRGVLFTQLAGTTAWLALPREELAAALARCAGLELADANAALDEPMTEATWTLLNGDPQLTHAVAEGGGLLVLEPGDAVLLATHDLQCNTWHSVFALGDAPSLAYSYGLFPAAEANRDGINGHDG